jgi:hypothetical protein
MNARIDLPTWLTGASSADDVQAYIDHGWSLVPIPPSSKAPKAHGWNQRAGGLKSSADLPEGWGIGLAHAYSGTCALDIDSLDNATAMLAEHGIDLHALLDASDAVQIVSGREGRAKLLYRLSEPLPSKKIAVGKTTIFELRCATSNGLTVQDVCPPSQHPQTGNPYRWAGHGHWTRLPVIPQALLDLWQSMLVIEAPTQAATPLAGPGGAVSDGDWADALSALQAIDPDCPYPEWIVIGMALHSTGRSDALAVWDSWSKGGTKYRGEWEIRQHWQSFREGKATAVTMGSVFKMARDAGWTRPQVDASGLFSATGGRDDWPEPMPLPNALPPVDPFDAGLLPVALRDWVMDIAHRMQCPADYPAVGALVALSSLIGARAVIQPKARDDWQVVPNLWGAVVGRPGVKKSPALNEALKPLHRLQAAEFELHKAAHDAWELDCKVLEMAAAGRERQAKGIADKDKAAARALLTPEDAPREPTARRYIVNDATVEKLGELLQQNEWGTLSYRDELYGLLTSLDKQGQEGSRAFYLTSYDGNQGYTFDRIGRGTVPIPRVCLAMIGGIQPGRIQEYVRGAVAGGGADDGLLQRFGLTVWPDVVGDFVHVDQWPDTLAKQTAWAVFDRLAQLHPASDAEPEIWRFTPAAQAIFVEWLVPFEIELRGDAMHPAMVSHLAKYRKLIPALALMFALIDTPDSGNLIGEGEIVRALAWGRYLRTHANRLYAAAVMPETTDAATLLSKIRGGRLTDVDGVILDSFTPRQIAAKGWAGLGTPEAVRKAADLLVDYDWLRRDVVPSSDTLGRGRPSDRYTINPAALKGGAA